MKKNIAFVLLVGGFILPANGQSHLENILNQVEKNNLQIKANEQMLSASVWESKSANSLDNPSISYSKVWDTKDSKDTDMEMTVSQGFDFPSVYFSRRKAIKNQNEGLKAFNNSQRQNILLEAKDICLEIIKLNQEKNFIEQRLKYAQQLLDAYNSMLALGNTSKLDYNKIKLNVLNQKTEYTIVIAELGKKATALQEINGNVPIDINQLTTYTEESVLPDYKLIQQEAIQNSYELSQSQYDYEAARKLVAVNKAGWLPGFEVGYKRTAGPGRHSNGFVVGMSIPLFKNRGQVSSAKATAISKLYEQDLVKNKLQSTLYQAYQEASAIAKQIADYEGLIDVEENLKTLQAALDGGELSITDYFVEASIMSQSAQNYLELSYLLQKQLAQLYKYRL